MTKPTGNTSAPVSPTFVCSVAVKGADALLTVELAAAQPAAGVRAGVLHRVRAAAAAEHGALRAVDRQRLAGALGQLARRDHRARLGSRLTRGCGRRGGRWRRRRGGRAALA